MALAESSFVGSTGYPHALLGHHDGDRRVRDLEDPVQLAVGAYGRVVEEHQHPHARVPGQGHCLLHGRVPVVVGEAPFGLDELRVVQQHVDTLDQVPCGRGHTA